MKTIAVIVGAALLIITGVLVHLLRSGGALKPAGVIKPAEVSADPSLIGSQIAVRLFPEFNEARYVIWRLEGGDETLADVPRAAFAHLRSPKMPTVHDLRGGDPENCEGNCWFILSLEPALPESVAQKVKTSEPVEIFVQYFNRDEKVPDACEKEKILDVSCMRSVSVREVRRKFKTPAPHYFMQRYKGHQFYLFIERPR